MKFTLSLIALALSMPAARARAAQLTLPDCLRQASENSVAYMQGKLAGEQASAAAREAEALRLPHLSAQGAYDKSDDPSTQLPDANKGVVRAEQTLTPFSAEWTTARRRRVELSAADLEKIQSLRDAERRVRQLYFGILQARQAVASMDEIRAQFEHLLNAVLPRYTMGRAPPFDVVKVRASLADLEKTRADQQAQLVGQSAELAQTLGMSATSQLDLAALSTEPPVPSEEQVLTSVIANPGLRALTDRALAARVGIEAARYSRFPQLVGAAEYGYSGRTPSETSLGWDLSLALRLPLFDWGVISSRVKQERFATELAQSRFELERQTLVSLALQSRTKADSDLSVSQRLLKLLPDTKQAAAAGVERYRRGASTILEATDGINLWLTMSLGERAAYFSYLSDLADLSWIEGRAPGADGL